MILTSCPAVSCASRNDAAIRSTAKNSEVVRHAVADGILEDAASDDENGAHEAVRLATMPASSVRADLLHEEVLECLANRVERNEPRRRCATSSASSCSGRHRQRQLQREATFAECGDTREPRLDSIDHRLADVRDHELPGTRAVREQIR